MIDALGFQVGSAILANSVLSHARVALLYYITLLHVKNTGKFYYFLLENLLE